MHRRTHRLPLRRRRRSGPGLALVCVLAVACGGEGARDDVADGEEAGAGERPRAVVSIFPLADLARSLVGDAVRVDVLLPPRASPATFEPTPRTVEAVSGADLHVLVGGGLDLWATGLLPDAPDDELLVLSRHVELVRGAGEDASGNPHVWLDPIRTRDGILPALVDALSRLAPAAAPGIRARGRALSDSLTALDREIDDRLAPVRSRPFVTTHPAWLYFVDRYDLVEVGSIHGHPGQEPSPRALAALVETARRAGVRAVFTEPQTTATAAAALARELGVELHTLDPLGGPGIEGRTGYFQLLRYNADQVVRALGGGRG